MHQNLLTLELCQAEYCHKARVFAGIFIGGPVGLTVLAQCDGTLKESGKTLDAPDERSSAFVNVTVGQRGTKETQFSDGRVLRRQEGRTVKTIEWQEPCDGARRSARHLCRCLCYAPSQLWSKQTRPDTLRHLPNQLQRYCRPTSAVCIGLPGLMHLSQRPGAPSSISMTTEPPGHCCFFGMEQDRYGNSDRALGSHLKQTLNLPPDLRCSFTRDGLCSRWPQLPAPPWMFRVFPLSLTDVNRSMLL